MITHVQTALRKAGNYDKTGRARKNMRAARSFRVHSEGRGVREVCGGEETRGCLGHRGQLCVATDCPWLCPIKFNTNNESMSPCLSLKVLLFFPRELRLLNWRRKIEIKQYERGIFLLRFTLVKVADLLLVWKDLRWKDKFQRSFKQTLKKTSLPSCLNLYYSSICGKTEK